MMWDEVMERVVAQIKTDITLFSIFGDKIRQAGTGQQRVPGLEWTLISDTESEIWAPVLVQFDIWHTNASEARRAERKLRGMYHKDLMFEVSGIKIWGAYETGIQLATPDRANYIGRGLQFRFTPLRRQYQPQL